MIKNNIIETKKSIDRLEILTLELEKGDIVLNEHEKLFTMATQDLEYPFWIKDLQSRFLFMNSACIKQILKTTSDAALLLTDSDFEYDALSLVCMETDKIVAKEERTYRGIEHARYSDGRDLWIDTTKSPLVMRGGIIGTVGLCRDITDQVPEDVREKYKESGWVEIPADLIYNSYDIENLL